jgi:MFS family permease
MVDLRLLGNGLFRTASLVSLFSAAGFLGVLFVSPLFLQEGLGVTPLTSGLTTFPEALGVVTSTQIVARLYPRVGPRRLMVGGLIGVTVMMALMSLLGRDTNLWFMRLLMFLTGAGMAYAFVSGQTATFATISSAATGQASALSNALRQLGSALGVAVLSEVISIVGPTRLSATGTVQPNLTAYHVAFLAAAMLALVAAGIALAISDRDAAPTMKPQVKQAEHEDAPEQTLHAGARS